MKPLRNLLLLLSYLVGILAIVAMFYTQTKLLPLPLIALALAGIAFAIVKTERRHARIPIVIGVFGVALAFAMPYIFTSAVDEDAFAETEAINEELEEEAVELINQTVEEGDVVVDEPAIDENSNNPSQIVDATDTGDEIPKIDPNQDLSNVKAEERPVAGFEIE